MKLPAVDMVAFAEPPGLMTGVENPPLSALALCGAVSLLVHVTTVPTATVTGLGEKAVFVSLKAPLTMLMVCVAGGFGVGAGGGVGEGAGEELLLHAARLSPATRINAYRIGMGQATARSLPRDRAISGLSEIRKRESPFENLNHFQDP